MAHLTAALPLLAARHAQETAQLPETAVPDTRWCRSLFDGKTLTGWVPKGGRYDGDAAWTVEDGAIVGRQGKDGAGGLLYTESRYTSFLLTLEARIDWPFDSGVFLHMLPPVTGLKGLQLTLDLRPGGEVGGVYADGWLQHNPAGMARFARDGWNRIVVRCTGRRPRLEAWLGGAPLVDFRLPPDRSGFAHEGRIGLQVHGDRADPADNAARFRSIALLELPLFEPDEFDSDARGVLTAKAGSGWQPLFDGRSLDGWQQIADAAACRVEDGTLVLPAAGDGYLRTREELADFAMRFDYLPSREATTSLVLRGVAIVDPHCHGESIPLLDDAGWQAAIEADLNAWKHVGSIAGVLAPTVKTAARPAGRWSTCEIDYRGGRLQVVLNGHALCDVEPAKLKAIRAPVGSIRKGFLALQLGAPKGDAEKGSGAQLRNLFVRRS